MILEFKRIDSLDTSFENDFSKFEKLLCNILSNSYSIYYGEDYHRDRIREGKAILYIAFINSILVAASYVKRNKRRGGTVVFPEKYRKLGLAQKLIAMSLIDFPEQYTILSTTQAHSHKMLALMTKMGFKEALQVEEIKKIVGDEFKLLSNFRLNNGYFVFDRISERRGIKREFLTLLHTYKND